MFLEGREAAARLADDGFVHREFGVSVKDETDVEDEGIPVVDRLRAVVLFLVDNPVAREKVLLRSGVVASIGAGLTPLSAKRRTFVGIRGSWTSEWPL